MPKLPYNKSEGLHDHNFEVKKFHFPPKFCSSANASPEFEGRGGEELAGDLAKALERAYRNKSAIDRGSLCIIPGQQCWVLYIDALVTLTTIIYHQLRIPTLIDC